MAAREVKRTLTVTADTSGLRKGAQDIQQFGQGADSAAAYLKRMRAELSATDYRSLAAGLKPVIAAEKEMAAMAREAERALKPFAAELRRTQMEALKAAETLNNRRLSEAKAAEALRKTYDTGYRNAQAYLRVEEQVARQIEARNLTVEQGSIVLAGAATRFKQIGDSAGAANQNVRLTASQMQGLGYQLNDVATMVALGASPFQVIASQAGQVVQVLGDGPQGMKGSLSAIGASLATFARAIPAAGYVVAGVTAAVGALWALTKGPEARSAEESVKSFEGALKRLEAGWKGAGNAAREHYERAQGLAAGNPSAALLDTQARARELRQDYQAAVRDLNSAPGLTETILRARSGGLSEAHREIRDLYTDLRNGRITVKEFADEMLRIRLDPASPTFAAQFADQIRIASERAQDLERQINAVADAAAKLGGKGGRVTSNPNEANPFDLRDRFGGVTGTLGKLDPSAMDGFRDQLRGQREGLEAYTDAAKAAQSALKNFDLSPVERQLADTAQTYDQRIAAYKRATTDTIGLAALQAEKEAALALISKEATRSEETRRAGYALDLKAVGDITAAQKVATAGQRAFNDAISQGYDQSYAAARSTEASALTMAQARQQASQAATEQTRATQRQIEQAQFEYDVVGQSAGEVARLRAEFDLLAQAKDAARSAGFEEATVTLTDSMRDQAAQIGRLTEATQRLTFERDLLFDRQQAMRSPEDQRIADQLRSIGVEFESAQGKADAAQLRLNNRLHEANDRLYEMRDAGKKAFGDLISSIGDGEGAIDSIAQAFAGLGQQLASAGFDRLFGNLFGGKSGDSKGGIGSVLQAISSSGAPGDQYAEAPLPPVVTGEGFSASKAATVASQSVPARVWNFFASKGLAAHQIAGIMGNAKAESAFNPTAVGDNGQAFGLFQWNDRKGSLFNHIGGRGNLGNVDGQLDFAWKELQTTENKAYRALLKATDITQATEAMLGFERPHGYNTGVRNSHNYSGRVSFAREAYAEYSGQPYRQTSSIDERRATTKAVSDGFVDANRKLGGDPWSSDGVDLRTASGGAPGIGGMGRGQAGIGAAMGLLGIAANGYQSGNVFSGGLSGLMGGAELASQFGGALGLGSAAGPIGMGVGAAVGIISSPLGKRGPATRADMRRRFAAYQVQKGNGRDSDQCVSAA